MGNLIARKRMALRRGMDRVAVRGRGRQDTDPECSHGEDDGSINGL